MTETKDDGGFRKAVYICRAALSAVENREASEFKAWKLRNFVEMTK